MTATLFEPKGRPFTLAHFTAYAGAMIFDDGKKRRPEPWQKRVAADLFRGVTETWMLVPEGNGKTTFMSQIVLYGAEYWNRIMDLEPMLEWGAISKPDLDLLQRADTPQQAFEVLKAHLVKYHLEPATVDDLKTPAIAKTND